MKKELKISAEAKNNKAVIRIDGYINSWNNHAAGFKAKLDQLVADGITEAEIYINSGGGSCFEANEISNEIMKFTGTKTARIGALCASAATYIACKCDKAIAARNVSYMIHKPMVYIEGNEDEIESALKGLKNLQAEYAKTYSEKTGLTVDEIAALWPKDYWMNADEAKKLGFIDEVEGEGQITPEDVATLHACNYKNPPNITATTTQENLPQNNIMKDKLIAILAVAATFTDAQIVAHIEELKIKAAKADDLAQKLATVTADANKAKIDSVITAALAKKQITAAQEAFYRKGLTNEFEETKAFIESLPVAVQLTRETGSGSGTSTEDRSKWTYADYQEKDPKALPVLAETKPEEFEKLFNAHYEQK